MRNYQLIKPNRLDGRIKLFLIGGLLMAAVIISGFVWANSKIQILVDGKTINTTAIAADPKEVLAGAGVYLGPKDEYRISAQEKANLTTIEVIRAVPVTMLVDGKTEFTLSGKATVGEVVASLGYDNKSYKTVPEPQTRPTAGMQIRLLKLSDKMVEKEMPIAFFVVRQPDPTLEKGMEAVVEAGVNGKKLAQVRQLYEDGKETGFEIITEKVLVEPKSEVLRVGTRDANDPNRGTVRFKSKMIMEATAYTPFDDGQSGITFSGIPAKHGIIAVDPRVIPLGTRVFIPGYGTALAADTGSAIKGDKIDLCIEDYNAAIRFGRRNVEVYILAD